MPDMYQTGLLRPRRNTAQPSRANPNATKKRPPALVRYQKRARFLANMRRAKLSDLIMQGAPTQRAAARILGVSTKTIYRDLHVINAAEHVMHINAMAIMLAQQGLETMSKKQLRVHWECRSCGKQFVTAADLNEELQATAQRPACCKPLPEDDGASPVRSTRVETVGINGAAFYLTATENNHTATFKPAGRVTPHMRANAQGAEQ